MYRRLTKKIKWFKAQSATIILLQLKNRTTRRQTRMLTMTMMRKITPKTKKKKNSIQRMRINKVQKRNNKLIQIKMKNHRCRRQMIQRKR